MKRRSFIQKAALASGAATLTFPLMGSDNAPSNDKGILELRIYHISRASGAKNNLEQYFSNALIPFMNKHNVKVGVYNEYSLEEPAKVYCLSAFPNLDTYNTVKGELLTDSSYLEASASFDALPYANSTFSRYETFLMDGFENFPSVVVPGEKKALYELRIYESPSDAASRIKINMFNKEEIALFYKVGINPVFFGRILAGQYMPALIYMVGFKDMAERDTIWGRFNSSEEWQIMRVKPEYPAGIVSNIRRIFLTPTAYSEI